MTGEIFGSHSATATDS